MALPLLRPALSLRPPASTTGRLKPCLAALPTVRKRKLGLQGLRKGIVLAQAASAAAVPVQDEPKKSPLQQWQEWWTLKSPSEEGKREEAGGIKRTKVRTLSCFLVACRVTGARGRGELVPVLAQILPGCMHARWHMQALLRVAQGASWLHRCSCRSQQPPLV